MSKPGGRIEGTLSGSIKRRVAKLEGERQEAGLCAEALAAWARSGNGTPVDPDGVIARAEAELRQWEVRQSWLGAGMEVSSALVRADAGR